MNEIDLGIKNLSPEDAARCQEFIMDFMESTIREIKTIPVIHLRDSVFTHPSIHSDEAFAVKNYCLNRLGRNPGL